MGLEQWYTLYTKPNAEHRVVAALQKRGIETYLPEIESSKTHQGRVEKPFFPCYLFARFDFETTGLLLVQWTTGLRHVVALDNRPVPLADEVIDLIRSKLGEIEANGGRPAHTFKSGDTVIIADGPFRGKLAILDGPATPTRRVQVLLDILGHANRVQVDVTDLEKAPASAEVATPERPRRTRGRGRRINSHN